MSTRKSAARRRTPAKSPQTQSKPAPGRRRGPMLPIVGGIAIFGVLLVVFIASRSSSSGGSYPYQVGAPGPGQPAPSVHLTATDGSTFDLGAQRGKTVLLYFQEGVGCQPCWTQITDIQKQRASFTAASVDEIVSITGDPIDALRQKVSDEHVSIPVLSDSGLPVSQSYHANNYGMMGAGADGHTFVLVGPDGKIRWRADYGGAPDYTMYVPVNRLLADLQKGNA